MTGRVKRVGVLTFHKCINYGSYWQARCLAEGLRARGHEVELLDHDCLHSPRRGPLRTSADVSRTNATRANCGNMPQKTRRFVAAIAPCRFRSDSRCTSPRPRTNMTRSSSAATRSGTSAIPGTAASRSSSATASRPVGWCPTRASFGNHSAWDGIHPAWARKLDRFSAISVRDENSWHIVRNGTEREPEMVLDPCLQFSGPAIRPSRRSRQPFAVVYGMAFPLG